MNIPRVYYFIPFLFSLTISATIVHTQGLTTEEVVSMETVGSVEMSHDGNFIAYTFVVPRQLHGLTERAHQLDFMNLVLNWFNEYLKD